MADAGREVSVEAFGGALEGSGDVAGLLADGEDVHHHGWEKTDASECGGEADSFADHPGDFHEEGLEVDIRRGGGHQLDAVEERDAVGDESREGLQHFGEKFRLKDGADDWQAEHG